MALPRTAVEIAHAISTGQVTASEVVAHSLNRIRATESLNGFTLVDEEGAKAAAREVDHGAFHGQPLRGVPFAAKDFTPTKGHLTTRGSWSTGHTTPTDDPVYVQRMKAAGAILIGKTTTPEFAYSSFTQSLRWGATRNPHDPSRTPGGSSGGAAVAVATGCVPLAEGSDMGGSVRIPAALSGVVGFKPSLGRIPMDILPLGPDSLSHFGPLAACVEDAELFLDVTEGPDSSDIYSRCTAEPEHSDFDVTSPRIALSVDLGYYHVSPAIRSRMEEVKEALRSAGAIVEPANLNWTRQVNDTWLKLWAVAQAANWGSALEADRERMDPKLVALMEEGFACSAVELRRLEAHRSALWYDLAALFSRYHVLVTPTCAVTAPRVDESDDDYEQSDEKGRFKGLDMTCPFNLLSPCPALSVPVGKAQGLPIGLQIVGPPFADRNVLSIGKKVEQLFTPEAPVA